MAARLSALRTCSILILGRFLVLIFVRGWVDSRAIARMEGLGQLKYTMTSLGIEPSTFLLIELCFNQLSAVAYYFGRTSERRPTWSTLVSCGPPVFISFAACHSILPLYNTAATAFLLLYQAGNTADKSLQKCVIYYSSIDFIWHLIINLASVELVWL
jgi:hypothetical protein